MGDDGPVAVHVVEICLGQEPVAAYCSEGRFDPDVLDGTLADECVDQAVVEPISA